MKTIGTRLVDSFGRTILLRGVNLSGSAKTPPYAPTHKVLSLRSPEHVSFVGRPFPLEQAEEHFARLRAFGMHFLRFVITWESIEHEGPGKYDQEYLETLHKLVRKADEYGLLVWIDPHQDVWSRFTGGDGAPAWTLSALGMKTENLHACGAAVLHSEWEGKLPTMIWPTNYVKLGAATMFTVFFAGEHFAPTLNIEKESAQEFLVRHYIAALSEVARRLRHQKNVVGYGSMNEPNPGYIGASDLTRPLPGMVQKGPAPSPLQSMALAAGIPQEVEVWEFSASHIGQSGTVLLNPQGMCLWESEKHDVWRREGVWDVVSGKPTILRPDWFSRRSGRDVNFCSDCLKPFVQRVLQAIRKIDDQALLFFEGPPAPVGHPPPWQETDPSGVVHAGHFYDGFALMNKHYDPEFTVDTTNLLPVFGREAVRAAYASQIGALAKEIPHVPFLLGEFGVPFDLDEGASFRTGDYSKQEAALDAYFGALDEKLLSGTLWNYTPDNANEWGDNWNGEDLSIFCADQKKGTGDLYDGGRALSAVIRPYAKATAGIPLQMTFSMATRRFVFRFRRDPTVCAKTEIFVPKYPYPNGFVVDITAGNWEYDPAQEVLFWETPETNEGQKIEINPR
ncbi:MAG TPA: cellulase family glycosylhydrolase [Pseudomonadota bacterium]|nr:cellulase family glycosylhydrolase [Pseudomonadota bacterium]